MLFRSFGMELTLHRFTTTEQLLLELCTHAELIQMHVNRAQYLMYIHFMEYLSTVIWPELELVLLRKYGPSSIQEDLTDNSIVQVAKKQGHMPYALMTHDTRHTTRHRAQCGRGERTKGLSWKSSTPPFQASSRMRPAMSAAVTSRMNTGQYLGLATCCFLAADAPSPCIQRVRVRAMTHVCVCVCVCVCGGACAVCVVCSYRWVGEGWRWV